MMEFKKRSPERVGVIGAGVFGSAMAELAARAKNHVKIWSRDPAQIKGINEVSSNSKYIKEFKFNSLIKGEESLEKLVRDSDLIIYACSSSAYREIIQKIQAFMSIDSRFLNTAKGLDSQEMKTHDAIFSDIYGVERFKNSYQILSGPSFALEIIQEVPTCVTIASKDLKRLRKTQETLHSENFRPYITDDVIGVEIGGALKNVIAIVAGCVEGMGLGYNAQAAIINRGLGEITKVALALGAKPETFLGLSGMGDLLLTCTGKLSRNRSFGQLLGEGKSKEEAQKEINSTIEGIHATEATYKLGKKLGLELSICNEAYAVLYENKKISAALRSLTSKEVSLEWS